MTRMRRSLEELTALLPHLPPERLRWAAGPGQWTTAQIVAHLADVELAQAFRIRLILCQQRPPLTAFDQDAWSRRLATCSEPQAALASWRTLRLSNLAILESLSESEWQRTGIHEELGELTLARLAEILAGHDEEHLPQLRLAARP